MSAPSSSHDSRIFGAIIGLASVFAGLTIAYYADLPPGGAIVLVAAGAFAVASVVEVARGHR